MSESLSADLLRRMQADDARLRQTETKETPGGIPGFSSFYETGIWVPTFQGSGTAGTFTYDATITGGEYARIGNRVFLNGRVRITAIAVAPTGDLRIAGLPFASASPSFGSAGGGAFTIYQGITFSAGGYTQLMLRITSGQSFLNLTQGGSNLAQANIQGGALVLVGGVASLDFIGQYHVA